MKLYHIITCMAAFSLFEAGILVTLFVTRTRNRPSSLKPEPQLQIRDAIHRI